MFVPMPMRIPIPTSISIYYLYPHLCLYLLESSAGSACSAPLPAQNKTRNKELLRAAGRGCVDDVTEPGLSMAHTAQHNPRPYGYVSCGCLQNEAYYSGSRLGAPFFGDSNSLNSKVPPFWLKVLPNLEASARQIDCGHATLWGATRFPL